MLENCFTWMSCGNALIGDNRTKYTYFSCRILLLCVSQAVVSSSAELIHVDKRKDRPESSSSSVELSRLFDKVIHLARNDALVRSVCLESLKYSILRD